MTSKELDKRVAELQGWVIKTARFTKHIGYLEVEEYYTPEGSYVCPVDQYSPTASWQQAGELIEKYRIHICPEVDLTGKAIWEVCAPEYPKDSHGFLDEFVEEDLKIAIVKTVIALLEVEK